MNSLQCRLCSCENNLICVFSGKNREIRNYIRKLLALTTGIRFEQKENCNFVCYNCVVTVYNFYLFTVRSKENERKLQSFTLNNKEAVYCKNSVDGLKLPEFEILKDKLGSWLLNKFKNISEVSDISVQCEALNSNLGVQTNIRRNSIGIQCQADKNDICLQTNLTELNTHEKACQSEGLGHVNVEIQYKSYLSDNSVQTNYQNLSVKKFINVFTQTEPYQKKHRIRCTVVRENSKTSTWKKRNEDIAHTEALFTNKDDIKEEFLIEEIRVSDLDSTIQIKDEIPSLSLTAQEFNQDTGIPPLLTLNSKVGYVTICRICDCTLYSKEEAKQHRLAHLRCHFCNKRFRSFKKTKQHMELVCMRQAIPVVTLERLDLKKVTSELQQLTSNKRKSHSLDYSNKLKKFRECTQTQSNISEI